MKIQKMKKMKNTKLAVIINNLKVPKVILRYIMMNFLNIESITKLILTVKEMNVLDNYSKDFLTKAKLGFDYNCKYGNINVIMWLYSLENIDIHADNEFVFRRACKCGHLALAQCLFSLGKIDVNGKIDINAKDGYAFDEACVEGHLPVVQLLYSLGEIDIWRDNEYAFVNSCACGHLILAQWLYSLAKEQNIYTDTKFAFITSCAYNHLIVAQWLYSLGQVDDQYAFNECCRRGNLDIARWLYSLGRVNLGVINEFINESIRRNYPTRVIKWLNQIKIKN